MESSYIDIKKYIYENNITEQDEIGEYNEKYYFDKEREIYFESKKYIQ